MYHPTAHQESRPEVLHQAMRDNPLGLFIAYGATGLSANLLPFEFQFPGQGQASDAAAPTLLRAHVARANPLWTEAADGSEVLVVFQGPQAYISPGWYATKAETGKVVPTWNYVMVQARGRVRYVHDAPWLRALVGRLTDHFEASQAKPWSVDDAPDAYIQTLLAAIVGVEIEVTALVGKWKVSQNRPAADRAGVVQALGRATAEMAQAMALQVQMPGS